MEYVCDAPRNRTWFRLVTEGEAVAESLEMHHAVEKHYRRERERAVDAFHPTTSVFIEQDINKEAHIRRAMPLFLTLRDEEAVVVPSVAVQVSQAGTFVFVVKDGAVQVRPVKVARVVDTRSVIAEGLQGGETVVTDGHLQLSNGTKITVRERKAGS